MDISKSLLLARRQMEEFQVIARDLQRERKGHLTAGCKKAWMAKWRDM